MGNFNTYSNYNKYSGVNGVIFGSGSKVLETELNEVQDIQRSSDRDIIRNIFGDGIYPLSSLEWLKDKGVLSIKMNTLTKEKNAYMGYSVLSIGGYLIDLVDRKVTGRLSKYPHISISKISFDIETNRYSVGIYIGCPDGYTLKEFHCFCKVVKEEDVIKDASILKSFEDKVRNGSFSNNTAIGEFVPNPIDLSTISSTEYNYGFMYYKMEKLFVTNVAGDTLLMLAKFSFQDNKTQEICTMYSEVTPFFLNKALGNDGAFINQHYRIFPARIDLLPLTTSNYVKDKPIYLKMWEEEVVPGKLYDGDNYFSQGYPIDIREGSETSKRRILRVIGTYERDYTIPGVMYMELGYVKEINGTPEFVTTCKELTTHDVISDFIGQYKPYLDLSKEALFSLFKTHSQDSFVDAAYFGLPDSILVVADALTTNGYCVTIPKGTVIYISALMSSDSSGFVETCEKFLVAEEGVDIPCYIAKSPAGSSKEMYICLKSGADTYDKPFVPLNRETCFLMDSSMNYSGAPVPDYHFTFEIGVNSIVNSMVQKFIPSDKRNIIRNVPAHTHKYNDITNAPEEYTHPTTPGNKHIPSGGSFGQYLEYASNGTAKWATPPSLWIKNYTFYTYPINFRESVDFLTVDRDLMQAIHSTSLNGSAGELLQLSLFISGTFTYRDGTVIIPFMEYLKVSSCSVDGVESYGTFVIYDTLEPLAHVRLTFNSNNKNKITAVIGLVLPASEITQNDNSAKLEIFDCFYSSDIW